MRTTLRCVDCKVSKNPLKYMNNVCTTLYQFEKEVEKDG